MQRYILIEGKFENPDYNLDKFKEDVNKKITEGYIPLGSPVIEPGSPWIMQAMFLTTEAARARYNFHNPNPLA